MKPGPLLTEYREARAAWQAFDIEADRRVARALVAIDHSHEPIPYDIYPRRHIMHPAYIYAPQPDDAGPPPEPAPAPPEAERFVEITQKAGLAMIAAMMIMALFNDFTRLIGS